MTEKMWWKPAELAETVKGILNGDFPGGIKTGFRELDEFTGGLREGGLTVIGSRSGMGKTIFALNLMMNISLFEGLPTAFFSMKQTKERMLANMLCAAAKVDVMHMREGKLSDEERGRLKKNIEIFNETPIYLNDSAALSITEICLLMQQLCSEAGVSPKAVFIDYIQLLRMAGPPGENDDEIKFIVKSLKEQARNLGAHVVVLTQLSQAVDERENQVPRLSDLGEWRLLEREADTVLFIKRPEYYEPLHEDGTCSFYVVRERSGRTGEFNLLFDRKCLRFDDIRGARRSKG